MVLIVLNSKNPTALNGKGISAHSPSGLFQVIFSLKLALHSFNMVTRAFVLWC